ncbi:D-TA family PLP-dependent enzyme [Tautonia plasticadhaerens]|uniref:D-threonine aldolase n=1 Tax=Tautonia plasticadhaerens TaxID=2527974 RepID=A0A518H876_9BACT|nr:D-TA family PLP-dependent enzyme [Tautonia plasticadhaerens]QDV37015.1 D-threonine aldolase [Tautonia plasticadhaerens]
MSIPAADDPRYRIDDPSALPSPALVVFSDLVRSNLRRMLDLVGSPDRLRPHVKTHKMPAIVRMSLEMGITKSKCATIAEAEMVARAGGPDVLLAYPLVGPNPARMAQLMAEFPETTFRAVVDDPESARRLSDAVAGLDRPLPTLVDLNVGMDRTGIPPGPAAEELYAEIDRLNGLVPDGLHAYDGHTKAPALDDRKASVAGVVDRVVGLRDRLEARGLPVPRLVMGGTPPFPIYAALDLPGLECSPGTIVLHDAGYDLPFPDLGFTPAALLLGRVVSRPREGLICLDIGTKAVASDPAGDRVLLLGIPGARQKSQNEEHLLVETPASGDFPPGTAVLAVPTHICPTCALHREAVVIEGGKVVDRWEVVARDRTLTI